MYKRGRIWWHRDPVTGRPTSTGFTDFEAARTHHRARERVAADPAQAAAAEAELGFWCDQLAAMKARGKSEATVRVCRQKLGQVLGVLGRECRLADITPPKIDEYVAERREHVTDHTIVKEFGELTQALKLAKRAGCYPGDIAALRPLDLHTGYVPRKRALTREEVVRLLAELEPKRGALVALCVGLGLRLSEAFRLTPADFDLAGGKVFVGGTKTEQARRYLPILSVTRSLVEEGSRHTPLERWDDVRRDLARACTRAGIERCTPNDLRRSFATLLIEAGVDRDVVRRLLGHTTSAMVDRVYGKPRPEALGELAEERLRALPPIVSLQVSDAPERPATILGANSRNRTGDTRFTKPRQHIVETTDSGAWRGNAETSGGTAGHGDAPAGVAVLTNTRQCSATVSATGPDSRLLESKNADTPTESAEKPLANGGENSALVGGPYTVTRQSASARILPATPDEVEAEILSLDADYLLGAPESEVDAELRRLGADPDEVAARGIAFVESLGNRAPEARHAKEQPPEASRTLAVPLADREKSAATHDRYDLAAAYARVRGAE